jgi:hypothetical protein
MKILITESQYNRLLLSEEKEVNFNFDVDTILAFAKLIGLGLKGQNDFLAKRALDNKEVLSKIYSIMTSTSDKEKMIEDLDNKGMMDSDKKLHDNIEKIVNNFNEYSTKSGLSKPLNLDIVLNKILRK